MTDLRTAAQQALEALELAYAGADVITVHGKAITALRAALVEDAMQKFTDVNQEIEVALAEPVPVAWMHVPYPGNAISPMLSLSKHREPSLYAATVPLYIKEQL